MGTGIEKWKCQLVTECDGCSVSWHTPLAVTTQCIEDDRYWSVKG
jgi:hypothetical protein